MKPAPLQLDFRRASRSAWRWLGWALLGAAVLAAAALSARHAQAAQRHAAEAARHQTLSDQWRARQPRAAAAPDARVLADVRRANAIIDQLTVPWDELFDAVEAADTRGLGLLAMTPTARDRTLRLAGEAKTMPDLLEYVERLAAQPALKQVHLVGYSPVARDGASVVSFNLAATWKGQP